jgi:hypothetical protein
MKFLRNISVLLGRHWEKFVLALALIGLIGAVWRLNGEKSAENEKIENYNRGITKRKPNPIPSVDVSQLSAAVAYATNPPKLDFSPPHNLFNPVKWQRRSDGTTIKAETGNELGIKAVQIAKISPLSLIITLDSQTGSGAQMSVTLETNRSVAAAQRIRGYVTTNNTVERRHNSRVFTMRDFRITPDGPEADIELADGTKMTISPSKPFRRVEAFKVDLFYPPEKQSFPDKRVGDSFTVAGETYNIVAITPNEVVVSARSNDRRTTIQNKTAQ